MNEAQPGAWVIVRVFSKTGTPIDVKASGANTAQAIEDLYKGIAYGMETFGWTTEQANAPKPATQDTNPAPQKANGNGAVSDTGTNTLEVVRVEVTPKPDGKAELKLYGEGHKFPDLYHNSTIANLITALSTTGYKWNEEQFHYAGEFNVTFYADWRNSDKLNKNGKPYKNIVGYRAIDATA